MMSRALLAAACFAFAAAESKYYKLDCFIPPTSLCTDELKPTQKCCPAGLTLDKATGACGGGLVPGCFLCGTDNKCDDPILTVSSFLQDDKGIKVAENIVIAAADAILVASTPGTAVTTFFGSIDGMTGWPGTNARFNRFRESLLGMSGGIPTFVVPPSFEMGFNCQGPAFGADDTCNLFVFLYRCQTCETFSGQLPQLLLASSDPEWHVDHCGPTFQLSGSTQDVQHPLVVYTAEVKPADVAKFDIGPEEVRYMFWGHVRKSVNCRPMGEAACNDADSLCRWNVDDDVCLPNICPPPSPFSGPQEPICQVCVGDAGPQEQLPEVRVVP